MCFPPDVLSACFLIRLPHVFVCCQCVEKRVKKSRCARARHAAPSRTLINHKTTASLLGKAQEFDSSTLQVIKVYCHDNEQADSDLQVEWVDAKQVATVGEQGHDDGPKNRANSTA